MPTLLILSQSFAKLLIPFERFAVRPTVLPRQSILRYKSDLEKKVTLQAGVSPNTNDNVRQPNYGAFFFSATPVFKVLLIYLKYT